MFSRPRLFLLTLGLTLASCAVATVLPLESFRSVSLLKINPQSAVIFLLCILSLVVIRWDRVPLARPVTAIVGGAIAVWFVPVADTPFLALGPLFILQIVILSIPALLVSTMQVQWRPGYLKWLYSLLEPYVMVGILWLVSLLWLKEVDLAWRWLIFYLWCSLVLPGSVAFAVAALSRLFRGKPGSYPKND